MDAIEKFDLSRGLKFETYAVPRIRGAIIDGLRGTDWVPRLVREKVRDISAAQATLERRLGRAATDPEVASELGVTVRRLRAIYAETAYVAVTSLDGPVLNGDAGLRAMPRNPVADDDIPAGLMNAVGDLPVRDQIIVALYYWEGLSLAEIGQVLQVSESRVSQLHSRAALTMLHKLALVQN
jgi:RNA polymerase sigma factor for flagellar operon FliA